MFDVAGRTALVTGSSRGIGRALAVGLLEAGCDVVLNGRDAVRLERTRAELGRDPGGTVHSLVFDASSPADVVAAFTDLDRLVPHIDILVNNVGIQHRAPFTELTDGDWQQLVDVNLTSAFLVSREAGRRMIARQTGKIINICSLQSELARPGTAAYAATKGALKMLTKGMCADLAQSGIQVNGIGPGYIETDMTAVLRADATFDDWVCSRTPQGRWGQVTELVGALLFLSSSASDYVNGQIIYVDGGMSSVL